MLLELRIGQIGLVEDLALPCAPGLTVLTGETGAGKSMIAGALALLRGGATDRDLVREGEDQGWVEAVFDLVESPAMLRECSRAGVHLADDGILVLRRELRREGRGRVLINGRLSSLSVLEALGSRLLTIQSQHQQLDLARPGYARDVLDSTLHLTELRREMRARWSEWRELQERLRRRRRETEAEREQVDLWRYQRDELAAAELDPCEEERLLETLLVQQNAAAIRDAVGAAVDTLEAGEGDVISRLGRSLRLLDQHGSASPRLRDVLGMLQEASDIVGEARLGLDRFLDSLDVDPAGLDELQERKSLYEDLRRKYRTDIPTLIERLHDLEERLARDQSADADLEELEANVTEARQAACDVAERLHRLRGNGAVDVARRALEIIRPLALQDLKLVFSVQPRIDDTAETIIDGHPCRLDSDGADEVTLMVATNIGENLRPVDRVASGGERSRMHLGLTVLMRAGEEPPLLLLDEVDAGLGMDAARPVAGLLRDLAADAQLICITHLPTMAVHGGNHWCVAKSERGGRTLLQVIAVTGESRVGEIERLLGGVGSDELGQDRRAFARSLLEEAGCA